MKTKDFLDGYIYPDRIGLLITLCPTQYANNDIYSIQRLVLWSDLYRMPLKCRNMAMLCLLEALSDEMHYDPMDVSNLIQQKIDKLKEDKP